MRRNSCVYEKKRTVRLDGDRNEGEGGKRMLTLTSFHDTGNLSIQREWECRTIYSCVPMLWFDTCVGASIFYRGISFCDKTVYFNRIWESNDRSA